MRDDIHKGAPVPVFWRSFIKHSAREADWRSRDPRFAAKAVAGLAKEVSRNFLNALEAVVGNPQLSLSGQRTDLEKIRSRLALSPLESCVVERLIDESIGGPLSGKGVHNAFCGALSEFAEAHLRAVEVHVSAVSPQDCPELMRRMRLLLAEVDLADTVANVLKGDGCKDSVKSEFDWDQNIKVGR